MAGFSDLCGRTHISVIRTHYNSLEHTERDVVVLPAPKGLCRRLLSFERSGCVVLFIRWRRADLGAVSWFTGCGACYA